METSVKILALPIRTIQSCDMLAVDVICYFGILLFVFGQVLEQYQNTLETPFNHYTSIM